MLIVAFGKSTISWAQVNEWYDSFKKGRKPTITWRKWRKLFLENQKGWWWCQPISWVVSSRILGLKCATVKFVCKLLIICHKRGLINIAPKLLNHVRRSKKKNSASLFNGFFDFNGVIFRTVKRNPTKTQDYGKKHINITEQQNWTFCCFEVFQLLLTNFRVLILNLSSVFS